LKLRRNPKRYPEQREGKKISNLEKLVTAPACADTGGREANTHEGGVDGARKLQR